MVVGLGLGTFRFLSHVIYVLVIYALYIISSTHKNYVSTKLYEVSDTLPLYLLVEFHDNSACTGQEKVVSSHHFSPLCRMITIMISDLSSAMALLVTAPLYPNFKLIKSMMILRGEVNKIIAASAHQVLGP